MELALRSKLELTCISLGLWGGLLGVLWVWEGRVAQESNSWVLPSYLMGGVYAWVSFKHWNVACRSVRKNRILLQNYITTVNPFLIINLTEERYPCLQNCCAFATETTPYWLGGPDLRPFYLIWMPFIFPGVCDGVCKDSDAPCFQSCPPQSEGNMKFTCKAKKWHKVTETCHTLNAMNMFEVRSFSPLSWILTRPLWVKWSFRWDQEAHLAEETGFHSSNGLWVHELINTYLLSASES